MSSLPLDGVPLGQRPSRAGRPERVVAADIRIGDVWKGKGATGQLVKVVHITRNPWECDKVEWEGVSRRTIGRCDLYPFPSRRTLHERNGLRIGDVRQDTASEVKILVLRGDEAVCDDADGIRTYPAAEIAALPLVSRKEP